MAPASRVRLRARPRCLAQRARHACTKLRVATHPPCRVRASARRLERAATAAVPRRATPRRRALPQRAAWLCPRSGKRSAAGRAQAQSREALEFCASLRVRNPPGPLALPCAPAAGYSRGQRCSDAAAYHIHSLRQRGVQGQLACLIANNQHVVGLCALARLRPVLRNTPLRIHEEFDRVSPGQQVQLG